MTAMTYTTTRRIGRAEWTKPRTLPSTWRTAAITVATATGFGVAVDYSQMAQWHAMTDSPSGGFCPPAGDSTCLASLTTAGTTMRAILQENYGEAENVLRLGQTGRPLRLGHRRSATIEV
jgi:hypothetical protein